MPEPITVQCAAAATDTLRITTIGRGDRVELDAIQYDAGAGSETHRTLIQLDANRARQVFRWLAAWLHERGEL